MKNQAGMLLALFGIAMVFALPMRAVGPAELEGRRVVELRYDPVVQPISSPDLACDQLVELGKPLSLEQVGTTIDRLYATGLYDDIRVYAEPVGDDGVMVRYATKPRRFVGHVEVRGKIKDPPNSSVIRGVTQLDLGARFDAASIETARLNVERELRLNALFKAAVSVTTVEDPVTHQVTIGFIVDAGKRARYEMPVISGDTKLPFNSVLSASGWRVRIIHHWRPITKELNDRGVSGIENRYAKKDRLMASVELVAVDPDETGKRATPHLQIDAGPQISILAPNTKIAKRNLRKYVPVYEEGSVDNDLLTEGARNLRDYFQSRGYPDAAVTFEREPVKDDKQVINYFITAGPRRRLVKIKIEGNHYFPEQVLRERMFLAKNSLLLRYGRYSISFRSKDEETIKDLYETNGFLNARISSTVDEDYNGKESDLAVTFHINEGPQWTISKLEIQGSQQLNLNTIREQLSSIENQPFAEVNVSTDRNVILQYYSAHGFVSASFRYEQTRDDEAHSVKLRYFIQEGERQFVRKVLISGIDVTHPSLVVKTLNDIHPGDPISSTKISDASKKLSDLGAFASVNTAFQDPDGNNTYRYVLFDFDEADRYTFNTGIGLEVGEFGQTTNSLSEAGGAKGVSPIFSFDINRINFLGRAQTLSLQTRYSTLEQRESLNYIVPRFLASPNRTLTISALYDTTQDVQTFSAKREEASAQVSQRLNHASTLQARFAYRRVSVGSVYIPALLVPQLSQPVRLGVFSLSYIQDHRDNPSDAHHGFYNTVDTALAGSFFGSQRSFVRVLARNATYTPIGHRFVFARQTEFGAILPFNVAPGMSSFDDIPLPERFFGGGSVSMRGFGDNQAGPRDIGTVSEMGQASSTATGFPIGGNGLFFNTLELRFPLLGPNISGVFFHDMGNIYTNLGDVSLAYKQSGNTNFNYAVQAPGFGVRYKTPLGPLRVDFSYALNPSNYQGYSNSLTIQQLLACGNGCPSGPQRLSHFNFFFSIGQAF
jgi:outer membrane protein assembly complex protein YaeT